MSTPSRNHVKRVGKDRKIENNVTIKEDKKWTENEIELLVKGIRLYGHKNLLAFRGLLPHKSISELKSFICRAFYIAKSNKTLPEDDILNLTDWLKTCEGEYIKHRVKSFNGSLEIATMLKLLSIDGIVENHPLPEHADGVDFAACYRMLYQAVLGYPIQPVNEPTLNIIKGILKEIRTVVDANTDLKDKLNDYLGSQFNLKAADAPENEITKLFNQDIPSKVVKKYRGKNDYNIPVLDVKEKCETIGAEMSEMEISQVETAVCSTPGPSRHSMTNTLNTNVLSTQTIGTHTRIDHLTEVDPSLTSLEIWDVDTGRVLVSSDKLLIGRIVKGMSLIEDNCTSESTYEPNLQTLLEKCLMDVGYNPLHLPSPWFHNTELVINFPESDYKKSRESHTLAHTESTLFKSTERCFLSKGSDELEPYCFNNIVLQPRPKDNNCWL